MRAGGLAPATLAVVLLGGAGVPRSMRAGGLAPATRCGGRWRRCGGRSFNEGRGVSPGDTTRELQVLGEIAPFNEGRGVSPGDTGWSVIWFVSGVNVQ